MKMLITILLIVGCYSNQARDIDRADVNELNDSLTYYKDITTGVCFAGTYGGFNGSIFTYVPCTPEIENIVHKFESK